MTRPAFILLLILALGCAVPVTDELREPRVAPNFRKLVLLPFSSDPAAGGSVTPDAAAVVTARILQALSQQTNLEIIPPGDAARVLSANGGAPSGEELRAQFSCDAVLSGVVRRYVERSGGQYGAAVWFTLEARLPNGERLWSGTYNETQQGLADDPTSFGRAWERGFRWVVAADLAAYGARELVRALWAGTEAWS